MCQVAFYLITSPNMSPNLHIPRIGIAIDILELNGVNIMTDCF